MIDSLLYLNGYHIYDQFNNIKEVIKMNQIDLI